MIHNLILNSPTDHPSVDIGEADVSLFSIPRSGSMMLFQLLQGMFPFGGVIASHAFIAPPPSLWCICSYRNFRDCTVSHWRYRINPKPGQLMSISEVRRFAGCTLGFVDAMNRYRQHQKVTWIQYEQHRGDPARVLELLDRDYKLHGKHEIDHWTKGRASSYLSRETQNKLCLDYQMESLGMSPGHVTDGNADWTHWLNKDAKSLLNDMLSKDLQDWGYET